MERIAVIAKDFEDYQRIISTKPKGESEYIYISSYDEFKDDVFDDSITSWDKIYEREDHQQVLKISNRTKEFMKLMELPEHTRLQYERFEEMYRNNEIDFFELDEIKRKIGLI